MQEVNSAQPTYEEDGADKEVSLLNILLATWQVRGWIAAGVLLALAVMLAVILSLRVANYQAVTQYVIEFRFDGRSDNRYPNGTPFSLGDIVAPAILTRVFEDEKLADFGMTLSDFQSAVSISPYTPQRPFIISAYNQSIDPRKATVAELKEAQDSLVRDLDAASNRYAVLGFTQDGFSLPTAKVSNVLVQIAQAWENNAINTRGVLKQDISTIDPKVFVEANVDGLQKLSRLGFVSSNLIALRQYLDKIASLPGGKLVQDKDTGFTIESLTRLVDRSATQLAELPAGWSNDSQTVQSEALGLPTNLYSNRLFDPAMVDGMDYPIAVDLLRDRIKLIRDNIQQITAIPGGELATDPETKLAARDVDRLLFDVEGIEIKELTAPILALGITKDPVASRIYYSARLQELQRQKQTLGDKARVLEQAMQSYQGIGAASGVSLGQGGGNEFPPGGSTVIPQFGDAFLDRIISLSQKGGDSQFRQDLLQKRIRLQQDATDIDEEIDRVSQYIKIFSDSGTKSPEDVERYQFFAKKIGAGLPRIMTQLRDYAATTQRIALRLKLATDIHAVAINDNPQQSGPKLGVDFYLRDVGADDGITMPALLTQLRGYTEAANRIYDKVSSTSLGSYMKLFRAAAEPQLVKPPKITRFEVVLLLLGAVVGGLLGLSAALVRAINRHRAGKLERDAELA